MACEPQRILSPTDYTVACLCPMGVELAPVEGMLDRIHKCLPTGRDHNVYTLGEIDGHNVVVAVMPEIGNNTAAAVATQLLNDFPSIRFGLLVGIGGGVPSATGEPDIRLGDVVVSQPTDTFGGVVQYDLGKRLVDGCFERTGQMNKPPAFLSASVQKLQAQHFRQGGTQIFKYLSEMMQQNAQMQAQYSFPADHQDQLFLPSYAHQPGATCSQCDPSQTVTRPVRPDHRPRIHYGTIGSANMVVKDSVTRDGLKKDMDILCVEMEAAGLMNSFPCLVIRGICDYADSHKNKRWQPYAAAVAAAYMKELLMLIPAQQVVQMGSAAVSTSSGRHFSGSQHHANAGDRNPEQPRLATGQSSPDPRDHRYPSISHSHSQTHLEMSTIREYRLAKSTASNDEIESMDNDEIDQRLTKRPRLDNAGVLCNFVARQKCTREQSQPGERYGDISVVGNSTTHIRDGIIHSCDHDHDCGQSRREALLESLTFDRMDARLRNVTRATPKTCAWLFRHKDFEAWLQDSRIAEHHGFLWLKGKPGSGKSTIMKNAWDWAKRRRPKNTIVLSYFFNARAPSALEKSCLGLYRSLVHQILCEVPESKPVFFDQFLSKERNGIVDEWTQEELQDFLIEVLKTIDAPPLQIFIDALDEGDENDVRKMMDFLQELGRHSQSSLMRLRICLSSRHYPYISIRNGLSLTVEHQPEHQHDIETYVQQNFLGEDTPQMVGLQQKVCSKADGVFLWVVLVVRMLKKECDYGNGILAMTKILEEIPESLEGLFADILKRSSEDKETFVSLLQWVLYSTRPLSSAELYLAIQFSQTATSQLDTVLPGKDQLNRRILKYSRGLVEQTKSQPPVIQFIHETVRDFLTGEKGLKQMQSALTGKVQGLSNDKLRYSCLRYIRYYGSPELDDTDKDSSSKQKSSMLLKSKLPLIDYAVSSLLRHADAAEKNGVSQITFLQQMQRNNLRHFCNWMQWRNAFERYEVRKYRHDVPLLYILVEYNLLSLIEALVSKSVDLNAVGGRYGNPLQAACFAGHEDIARFLLQNGASVNKLGGEYKHALLAAIYSKKPNIIALLRQQGASLAPETLTKPLFEMIARNYTHGVQIIMEYGVDTEARNCRGETPLFLAASKGNIVLVDLLFQKVKRNPDNELLIASKSGHEKIVQMLLNARTDVDVNFEEGIFSTALQAALEKGHEKIVQMLLDAGADVNIQGRLENSVLQAASASGHEKMVQMLLNAGVDVNIQEGYYGSALQAASARGHEKIVQMLLDAGADVNIQGEPDGSALQAASASGHGKIVQMLLDAGADVNIQEGLHGSALQAASASGHGKIVQMLLDAGADVNIQEGPDGSALQAASRMGHKNIVQMLLNAGVDVNVQGGYYGSALQAASAFEHEKIVQMLLLHAGVDVNVQEGYWGSALQAASRMGHKNIVQMLRNAGAVG